MKKLILFVSLCFSLNTFKAQIDDYGFSLTPLFEYSTNLDKQNYSGGIQLEVPVTSNKSLTLNYSLLFGASDRREFYMHSTAGGGVGSWILTNLGGPNSFEFINTLGIILMFIPEGITFYPMIEAKKAFGIYINPLGMDYWKKYSYTDKIIVTADAGAKLRTSLYKQLGISGHLGGKYLYYESSSKTNRLFIVAGLGLTIYLN